MTSAGRGSLRVNATSQYRRLVRATGGKTRGLGTWCMSSVVMSHLTEGPREGHLYRLPRCRHE